MNQLNEGESSSGPLVHSSKRRRGRPRKDPSLKRIKAGHVPPGFDRVKERGRTDGTDSMVGQSVSGVVEATFDAGYLLSVRIGNSTTSLRGVVFKPGHFVPVTAENDVAPHVPMIRRNNVYVPAESQGWSHGHKLVQTAIVPSKRKHASPKMAPSVPPVGARGTVVPVILQPVNISNGLPTSNQTPSDESQSPNSMAFGDGEVHMVEPLSMLLPDRSIPVSHIFMGAKNQISKGSELNKQVSHGSGQNNSGSRSEGACEVGEKGKSMKTDVDIPSSDNQCPSQLSDNQIENGKVASKCSAEDSGIVSKQETENQDLPVPTEALQTSSVIKPFLNYGTGRMTELLQALQENMKENQVQFATQPTSASQAEFHETPTPETDVENEAMAP